ncbi:MAG TPA: hypothetical protein VF077_13005 [Nitrospiraceae bacterium]
MPNPVSTAQQAIGGNLANLPELQRMAALINQFNTGQGLADYNAALPGYGAMVGQSSQNIQDLLAGRVSDDEVRRNAQWAAERGIMIGSPGSQNQNAALLEALNLTSRQLQAQGEQALTGAIARTPVPPQFNIQQFLTSPEDQQAAQMAANLYASAPNPQQHEQELERLFQQMLAQTRNAGAASSLPISSRPVAAMGSGGPVGAQSPFEGSQVGPSGGYGPFDETNNNQAAANWAAWAKALTGPQSTQVGAPARQSNTITFGPGSPGGPLYGYGGAMGNQGGLYGFGASPAGTSYNPFTDTSINMGGAGGGVNEFDWDSWLNGGPDTSWYLPGGALSGYSGPTGNEGGLYGFGGTPQGTTYDPFTDTSVNPGGGDIEDWSWLFEG